MANSLSSRKYFFIYKTINLLNGKWYIGMHTTSNLKDGYLGSGKYLRYSIRKHGKENFKCEILEFLENIESLTIREKEIVNFELLKEPLCMNLKEGGIGGNLGKNGEHLGGDNFKAAHLYWKIPENRIRFLKIVSQKGKLRWSGLSESKKEKILEKLNWIGGKHKEESKLKIGVANSVLQKGEKKFTIRKNVDNKRNRK